MYVQDCNLSECLPPHGVTVASHCDGIAASMRLDGWAGRPLLGWWDDTSGMVYLLTGSHRYAAARAAGLDDVPVALVEVADGRLEGQGDELYIDGVRVVDFCGAALTDMLRSEDADAADLLAADCTQ